MEGPRKRYEHIQVDGSVSVKLVDNNTNPEQDTWSNTFLLLGPTGAGKSAFIEALASDSSLQISSHQLEGFTQKISTYQLVNATRNNAPIYILDVPGFADTKVSEMGIVSMLKEYMNENQFQPLDQILYLMPINNPRLPGSHRKTLKTFQALTVVQAARGVVIVTTMWNCVWGNSATKRAEATFTQLQDIIWKDYIEHGSRIVKYQNTQESALSVLSAAFDKVSGLTFKFRDMEGSSRILRGTAFASNIYDDLQI
ncbi:hypothetical protein BJ165DRAFT_1511655 [Panaeolus papilionaceus]|nr:hypothetical protein BJ165DRAFT_1511655 [Panaeolus papilionaceus]